MWFRRDTLKRKIFKNARIEKDMTQNMNQKKAQIANLISDEENLWQKYYKEQKHFSYEQ